MPKDKNKPKRRVPASTQSKVEEKLELGLIENALDYLLSAAEQAGQDSSRNWKYAVLHLFAGIELMLKARLQEEHWSLLFVKVDDANLQKLRSGDFRSVDFETCCQRLRDIADVDISTADFEHLNQARKIRNRIQHFGVEIQIREAKSIVAKGIDFALRFFRTELPDAYAENSDMEERIVVEVKGLQEFVQQRLKTITVKLKDAGTVVSCPRCWQNTMIIGEGEPRCAFCDLEASASGLAAENAESSVEECPECGETALSLRLFNNDEGEWLCFSCGTTGDYLSECSRCGGKMFGDGSICTNCFSQMVNRDD